MPLFTRIRDGLMHEPSYFFEAASALGILLWSLGALSTDDFAINGRGYYVMPLAGLVFGLWRLWLIRRDPIWRALVASVGIYLWPMLAVGMFNQRGIVPMEGPCVAFGMGDLLTTLKFSIIAWETLRGPARSQS